MTLFTSQSAIACALAAAITFGGGAAQADALPDTPTASATPAPTETAPTETPAAAETSAPTEPPAATPSPFASHALEVRGLGTQVLNISSTSLRNHLVGRGFRETADSPAARRNVKLGDVIQFDWRNNGRYYGDRDHTGIVTRIDRNANGTITIRYTAHTDPGNDPKVNQTIEASLADWGHDRNGGVFFISI